MPFGDELGADDEVVRAPRRGVELGAQRRIPPGKSDESTSVRISGNNAAASSASRSTPGPQAVRVSGSWHSGHSFGRPST